MGLALGQNSHVSKRHNNPDTLPALAAMPEQCANSVAHCSQFSSLALLKSAVYEIK